jgi:hypothetical protein
MFDNSDPEMQEAYGRAWGRWPILEWWLDTLQQLQDLAEPAAPADRPRD